MQASTGVFHFNSVHFPQCNSTRAHHSCAANLGLFLGVRADGRVMGGVWTSKKDGDVDALCEGWISYEGRERMGGVFIQLSCDEKRARILLPRLCASLWHVGHVVYHCDRYVRSLPLRAQGKDKPPRSPVLPQPYKPDHRGPQQQWLSRSLFHHRTPQHRITALAHAPGCRSASLVLKTWGKIAPQLV
jgi:hypothetical protein